ncbi:MAG: putative metal-binding motif-containing protein [Alphaproteobacteria bacterium]|nr:putative metal-binding motif-containing protein [Alphaproteobacteria bacterium]
MWPILQAAWALDVYIPDDAPDIATALEMIEDDTGSGRVVLPPGVHVESVFVQNLGDIVIEAISPGATVWMPQSGEAVRVSGTNRLTLRWLYFQGSVVDARAVYALATPVDIDGSWFEGFQAPADGEVGGAIYSDDDVTLLGDTWFGFNSTSTDGGHIGMEGGQLDIRAQALFHGGDASRGGAIAIEGGTLSLDGALFSRNTAGSGGALFLDDVAAEVQNAAFAENTATVAGGVVHAVTGGDLQVVDSAVYGNGALSAGGISTYDVPLLVRRTAFVENTATYAAAIGCGSSDPANAAICEIIDSAFLANQAQAAGGAMLTERAELRVTGSTFCGNHGELEAGAIGWIGAQDGWVKQSFFFDNRADLGGAIQVTGVQGLIEENTFVANGAWTSGAVLSFAATPSSIALVRNAITGSVALPPNQGAPVDAVHYGGLQLGSVNENGWHGNVADTDAAPGLGSSPVTTDPLYAAAAMTCSPPAFQTSSPAWQAIGAPLTGLRFADADADGFPDRADCDAAVAGSAQAQVHIDVDRDGFGGPVVAADHVCPQRGWVTNSTDCDDHDPLAAPRRWWPDLDGDGLGDGMAPSFLGCQGPENTVDNDLDCDDSDASLPSAQPVDADGDGYGGPTDVLSCTPPTLPGFDCNDGDAAINPGATEVCNGVDDDCDGASDEGFPTSQWWADADGDGYGDEATTLTTCAPPSGWVDVAGDCDDAISTVNPGAAEICDGIDNDCDGFVDDGMPFDFWYVDADGDGYGDDASLLESCAPPGANYVAVGGDCALDDPSVSPGATEVPADGVDSDCDGLELCYVDADDDGYGTEALTDAVSCDGPGVATNPDDCDDDDPAKNPAGEACEAPPPGTDTGTDVPEWGYYRGKAGACGCRSTGGAPVWALLGGLLALRRRVSGRGACRRGT